MTTSARGAHRPLTHLRNALLGAGLALAAAQAAGAAQLVQNGDFEANGGSLAGWTVAGSVTPLVGADYVPCCGTFGAEPGFSHNHFAAFGIGNVEGTHVLSQTFTTQVGATYHLSFDAGALGWPGDQALDLSALGSFGGATINNTSVVDLDGAFKAYDFDFTATAATTVLGFTVNTMGVDGHDAVLDNVSLTEIAAAAVPEPASWALMTVAFFGLGGALRASRRRAFAVAR